MQYWLEKFTIHTYFLYLWSFKSGVSEKIHDSTFRVKFPECNFFFQISKKSNLCMMTSTFPQSLEKEVYKYELTINQTKKGIFITSGFFEF